MECFKIFHDATEYLTFNTFGCFVVMYYINDLELGVDPHSLVLYNSLFSLFRLLIEAHPGIL